MSEEIKIDGIPIQDYATPNSKSCYPGEINIGETIKSNIDYWKNLYFEEKEKNKKLKEMLARRIKYTRELEEDLFENCNNYVISTDKIRAKIEELEIANVELTTSYIPGKVTFQQAVRNEIIKYLKELLEEE